MALPHEIMPLLLLLVPVSIGAGKPSFLQFGRGFSTTGQLPQPQGSRMLLLALLLLLSLLLLQAAVCFVHHIGRLLIEAVVQALF